MCTISIHDITCNRMFFILFSECPKSKTNCEKSLQAKIGTSTTKLNGEKSLLDNDKDKLSTKESIMNGTENTNVVNGDVKNISDCDISSSDNTKIVSNGINSDSDDVKSNKSNDGNENLVLTEDLPLKVTEPKAVSAKKKESKRNVTLEKPKECEKKKPISENVTEDCKEENASKQSESDSDKKEVVKVVNGEKERESSPSEDGDDKKRDAEVVFIQDMGFTVKIVSPKAEPLDIQVRIIIYYI